MNHAAGLGYDAAGNLTNYSASGQYVYDPENRIQTTAGVTYTYDADGDRVEKSGGTTNTIYGTVRRESSPNPISPVISNRNTCS